MKCLLNKQQKNKTNLIKKYLSQVKLRRPSSITSCFNYIDFVLFFTLLN